MKKYRVTAPLSDVPLVMDGIKVHTVRFDQRLDGISPGDSLVIAFGAYNNPTVHTVEVDRVARVNVGALLELDYDMEDWETDKGKALFDHMAETDPLGLFEQLKPQTEEHQQLLALSRETNHNPFDLMNRAEETQKPLVFGIWWKPPRKGLN